MLALFCCLVLCICVNLAEAAGPHAHAAAQQQNSSSLHSALSQLALSHPLAAANANHSQQLPHGGFPNSKTGLSNRRINGPGENSSETWESELESEVEDEAEEMEKDLTSLERHVIKNVWEHRDFQHPAHQGDVDVAQGWLLLASIFLTMISIQLWVGGWNCAGGKLQKGDEQQRQRANLLSQFGAIKASCNSPQVTSQPAAASVQVAVARSQDMPSPRNSESECSIELIEFQDLPSADSARGESVESERKLEV